MNGGKRAIPPLSWGKGRSHGGEEKMDLLFSLLEKGKKENKKDSN